MTFMPPLGTVLCLDPDVSQQPLIANSLGPQYRLLWATTIAEAEAHLGKNAPIMLLVELSVPHEDVLQWIKHLRAIPRGYAMIIICVTTLKSVRDKIAGFHAGADDYLVKPINRETLVLRMRLLQRVRTFS